MSDDRRVELLADGALRITETDITGKRLTVVIADPDDVHAWLIEHGAQCHHDDERGLTNLAADTPVLEALVAEANDLAAAFSHAGNDVLTVDRSSTLDRLKREHDEAIERVRDYTECVDIAQAEDKDLP
jgi:hypothetical protein